MTRTRSFEHAPDSVTAARRFVIDALRDAPPGVLEEVQLMVSELASNCIRHTASGFDLSVMVTSHGIRVEATDRGGGEPRMRSPAPTDPSGRGLQIIDMFASDWGVDHLSGEGKTVWLTVGLGASGAAEPACA